MMKCKENRLKGLETILCKMRSKNIQRMKWFKSEGVTIYFVLCRHATLLYWRGALRDVTKNGCVADYFVRRYWENAFEGKNLMFLLLWGARVAQWHPPPTSVARVPILASRTPYVGWVCCCFSHLLREVFLQVLPSSWKPTLPNSIPSGTHGHVSTSS